jgi:flagellar basal-body rod modification protein FlgD
MSYVDTGHILGSQERRLAEANTPQKESDIRKDDFLTILVAQLTHQDPMNPMKDTDMTSQLSEFSQLEQLTNINTGIESMIASQTKNDMFDAVGYMGKDVTAQGYKVSKGEGEVAKIFYGAGEAVSKIKLNIYDQDGAIVRTVEMGSKQAGSYEYEWDGRNDAGEEVPDGIYSVGILAEDTNGEPVMMQTEIAGKVSGVVNEQGQVFLRLEDGRYINFANVKEVVDPAKVDDSADGGDGSTGSDGENGSDGDASADA